MRKTIFILLCTFLTLSCMTEDIHTMLKNQEDHEIRIQAFEALCKTINETTLALQAIVEASTTSDYITNIQQNTDGYTLTFARQGTFTLYHGRQGETGDKGENGENGDEGKDGTDGADGKDGKDGLNAPRIGIAEEDGILYWTQTLDGMTQWLLSPEGQRMKVNGDKGENGTEGTPGIDGNSPIPTLGIDSEGYWLLNNQRIKDINGKEVKAKGETGLPGPDGSNAPSGIPGPGMFKQVIVNENAVTFELVQPAGTTFTLPRYEPITLILSEKQILNFNYGSSYTLTFTQTGVTELHFITPSRWRVEANISKNEITIIAPYIDETNIEISGMITVIAFNGRGQSLQSFISVAIAKP